jgi:Lamin Tail Domain
VRLVVAAASVCFLVVAALVAGLQPANSGTPTNVLQNPGFESGLVSWTSIEGLATTNTTPGLVRSGSQSALVTTAISGRGSIRQSGPAFPGTWQAEVYTQPTSDGPVIILEVEFFDASFVRLLSQSDLEFASSGSFTQLGFTVTAPAGTTSFDFTLSVESDPGVSAAFDDAFLGGEGDPNPTPTETPTPPETPTPTPTTTPDDGDDDGEPDEDDLDSPLLPSSYLRNGNFEFADDGISRHWRSEGGTILRSDTLARSGSFAGRAMGNLSTPIVISQTVRLSTVGPRRFSVFALGSPPGGTVQLEIQWLMTATQTAGPPIVGDLVRLDGVGYQEVFVVSAPPPRAAGAVLRIRVTNGHTGSDVFLDDASWRGSVTTPAAGSSSPPDQPDTHADSQGAEPLDPSLSAPDPATLVPSDSQVLISEFLYAPAPGGSEWVELYNAGDEPIVLSGWSLFDNFEGFELAAHVLAPGAYLTVLSSGALPTGLRSGLMSPTGTIGNGLANDGDRVLLLDASGRLVDALSYGDDGSVFSPALSLSSEGLSLSRRAGNPDTDAASDFEEASPTPGRGLLAFTGAAPDGSTTADDGQPSEASDESDDDPTPQAASDATDDGNGDSDLSGDTLLLMFLGAAGVAILSAAWLRREEIAQQWKKLSGRS